MGGGAGGYFGVFKDVGDGLTLVADSSTQAPGGTNTFLAISNVSLDGENVAFIGSDGGTRGIYTDALGQLTKILDTSDIIDGRQPSEFHIGRDSLVGNQLAFRVRFTDNTESIYVATLVPEPSTLVAFLLATACLVMCRNSFRH